MSERKRKKLGELEQEISICKANLSLSEGKFVSNLSRSGISIPDSQKSSLQQTAPSLNQSAGNDNDDVITFIKNLSKLRDNLEEKNSIMQTDYERTFAVLQNEASKSKSEAASMQAALDASDKQLRERNEECNALRSKTAELEKHFKQRTDELGEQLKFYKKQNVEVKLQNKSLKADNRIIMNHIDRITNELKVKEQAHHSPLEEREMRVMRSLYQETLPNIELKESQRHHALLSEPKNKIIADELTDRNGELKTMIRRLNEEIELLKKEKQLLAEENRQKYLNLENQKMIVALMEDEKKKMSSIINKMGEKIMSLEEVNQSLKEAVAKASGEPSETDESYYRTTRAKVGQFYYKK